jgi:hypothetical protein
MKSNQLRGIFDGWLIDIYVTKKFPNFMESNSSSQPKEKPIILSKPKPSSLVHFTRTQTIYFIRILILS